MLSDIAALATAVGVFLGIYQLRLGREQARASFEQQFVSRYWAIEDDRIMGPHAHPEAHHERYARLCEDEFELMRLGQISWATWEVWHDGIRVGIALDRGPESDDEFKWTRACLQQVPRHSGTDCNALFAPDGDNPDAISRRRGAPSRLALLLRRRFRRAMRGSPQVGTEKKTRAQT
jgi:hypothetical protein